MAYGALLTEKYYGMNALSSIVQSLDFEWGKVNACQWGNVDMEVLARRVQLSPELVPVSAAQQVVPAFWVWCRAQSNTDPSPPVTAASGSPDRWWTQRWVALCWSGYHRCTGHHCNTEQYTHLEPITSTTKLSRCSYNDCPLSTGWS